MQWTHEQVLNWIKFYLKNKVFSCHITTEHDNIKVVGNSVPWKALL